MKNINIDMPNTEQEFESLDKDAKEDILSKCRDFRAEMNSFIVRYIEDAIAPILIENPWIKELCFDPKYEYNDEGYAPQFVMPFINGEYWAPDDGNDDAFEKLDYACAEVANLLMEDIGIDVDMVKARYTAQKLDKELPSNQKSKPRFKA